MPGSSATPLAPEKAPNSPPEISGAATDVSDSSEVSVPCTVPCSDDGTVPATRPWIAGPATAPRLATAMTARSIHPSDARP